MIVWVCGCTAWVGCFVNLCVNSVVFVVVLISYGLVIVWMVSLYLVGCLGSCLLVGLGSL